ncbi:FGGY-family carbohydrate kinase [Kytococcus sp. Marseille-QA3725]
MAGLSIGTSAALQVETVLRQLETVHPVEQIRATGGVFRSDLWRDVLSAVLDRPLVVAAGAEGSGLGAAALGARALGLAPDLDAALQLLADEETLTGQEEVIEPDPERVARYDRLGDQVADTLERLPRAAEVLRAR